MKLDTLYARLPVPAQHVAVTAYGLYWKWLRFGPGYRGELEGFLARERWSREQFETWQRARLREVLGICADRVPYYRSSWSDSVRTAARRGELAAVPMLEKDPLRKDARAFVRDDVAEDRELTFNTSGTTGTPLRSFWTVRELRRSIALREARSLRWAGVSYRVPRATLASRLVEPDPASRGPYYRYNAAEHQVYLSSFHVSPDSAPLYARALARHHVRWLTGFVGTSAILARFLIEQKVKVEPLTAFISTSEVLSPEQRDIIARAFGCRVFEEYSTVDSALFAGECEAGGLHVSPDVGVIEILRPDGSPAEPGEAGEVVTTCLLRDYQPLIRFRIGDVAAWTGEPCRCGRAMPTLREVVGRVEDVIVGPDGRAGVRLDRLFTEQPNIRQAQIIQETPDRLRVLIVPAPEFGEAEVRNIVLRARERMGPSVQVTVETVERIPLTAAGKFRAVLSHVRERPNAGT